MQLASSSNPLNVWILNLYKITLAQHLPTGLAQVDLGSISEFSVDKSSVNIFINTYWI